MPRKKRGVELLAPLTNGSLVNRLAEELKANRDWGQPVIEELESPTGNLSITVIWDAWDRLPQENRTVTILRAYELVEGGDYRDRVALASGLTVPEAYSIGMLPFQIIPVLRKSDPVTPEECLEAMIQEGASVLMSADRPQLRFTSLEDAEAAMRRLVQRLPSSDQVWAITQEASAELKLGWSAELG